MKSSLTTLIYLESMSETLPEILTQGITLDFLNANGFEQWHNSSLDEQRFVVDGDFQAASKITALASYHISICRLDEPKDVDAEVTIWLGVDGMDRRMLAKFYPNDESIKMCKKFIESLPIQK